MPLTRKSVELPVRATRSQGSFVPAAPVSRGRGASQKTVTPKADPKDAERVKSKAARAEIVLKNPKDEVIQPKRSAVIRKDSAPNIQRKGSNENEQNPDIIQKAKKRAGGDVEMAVVKRQKSNYDSNSPSQADIQTSSAVDFSPRRSSRAVVPNSRYKDMEMLEPVKRKTADSKHLEKTQTREEGHWKKTDVKVANIDRGKTHSSVSIQSKVESEMVTEEVITEETSLDAQAQMNLFNEVLVLPTASVAPPTSSLQQILTPAVHKEPVTVLQTGSSSLVPGTAISTQAIIVETEPRASLAALSEPIAETFTVISSGSISIPEASIVQDVAACSTDEDEEIFIPSDADVQQDSSFLRAAASPAKMPSPQVIVVKGLADGRKDKAVLIDEQRHAASLMPKFDSQKQKLAEQFLLSNQRTTIPDESRRKQRKIIVTPTHTARNEANRKAKEESERLNQMRIKGAQTADKNKSLLSSILTGKAKVGIIKPGEIHVAHQPEKNDVHLESENDSNVTIPFVENSGIPNTATATATVNVGSVQQDLKYTTVSEAESIILDNGSGAAVTLSKMPAQVVYVRTKPKAKEHETEIKQMYKIISSPSRSAELNLDKKVAEASIENVENQASSNITTVHVSAEVDGVITDEMTQEDDMPVTSDANQSTLESSVVNEGLEEGVYVEDISAQQATTLLTSGGEEVILEGSNDVTEMGQLEDKKLQDEIGNFCQVIPVDQKKEGQIAIEYVVFGDKMVPIHKPVSKFHAHGQITTDKPHSGNRHGRVEVVGQSGSSTGFVRKIPLDAAQTAISSVLAQMGEEKQPIVLNSVEVLEGLPEASDTSVQMEEPSTEDQATDGATEQQTRVIHGYIDRHSDTVQPTQIVEISQDLFAKEVYAEAVLLDQVTGEVMPGSIAGVETSRPMETEAVPMVITLANPVSTGTSLQSMNTSTEAITEASRHAEESIPDEVNLQLVSSQIDAEPTEAEDQSEKFENQSEQIINQVDHVAEESSEIESKSVSVMTQSVPTTENTTPAESDTTSDSKVTTHYNKDGSMVIRIEGTRAEQNKTRLSAVTVPNIIRVASSKPGVYKPSMEDKNTIKYKTIPAGKVYSVAKGLGYKKLVDVKINPAVAVMHETTQSNPVTSKESVAVISHKTETTVTTATSTQTQTEIETQTETMEGEDNEEEEEGIPVKMEDQEVVLNKEDVQVFGSTKMTVREDGQVQEYVVVSLPEGKEIKNYHVPALPRDPVHDEVVTMSEDGMYICLDCDHKTEKKSNWYKHRRKHLGIRPHACDRCNYRAATSSNLKRHMQIHDDVRNFLCNICHLYFRQKIHLERHIKYKHQEKRVKCPLCDYLCSSENPDLKIHIRRRHMPHEGGGMAAFTCEECGLMTVSKKDLKQHMKFHKKGPELKLFCEFCSFVTDCESRLRRHILIHTKERPFQCGLCAYRASQKEHVLRHMKSQHDVDVQRKPRRSLLEEGDVSKQTSSDKNRRFVLEGLPQTTQSLKDLSDDSGDGDKGFEKTDYSSTDKIFACNHCSMKFSKLINLYKHLYVQHKQVMPDPASSDFQCVVCEFRTNNKKNLLVHMRKHNMQDHTPPSHVYSCVLCRYMNPRRRNLFQHMKKKHGIEIVMKEDGSNCYVTSDNTSVVLGNQPGEANVMALSEIVTMETIDDDNQLQIVTEDGNAFQGEKISIDNIISVEDMAAYVSESQDQPSPQATIVNSSLYQTVAEHEAAEAIEGLQALAQQPGVLETQTIDNDITAEIVTSEILSGEEVMSQREPLMEQVEDPGIQLSSEQINQLSTGDYVEINGEVYKVEIAQEGAMKGD